MRAMSKRMLFLASAAMLSCVGHGGDLNSIVLYSVPADGAEVSIAGQPENREAVPDNHIADATYDFHSRLSFNTPSAPYFRPTLAAAPAAKLQSAPPKAELPSGDYWVEPMRQVHKKFNGRPGTLAQYGDSITVTMAFLAGYAGGKEISPKNCARQVKRELNLVAAYADRGVWREWKGAEWGNTGMMKSDWLLANVAAWQKKMRPEVAVVLFGTNDLGSTSPDEYRKNMAAALQEMLDNGTIPILTTVPPCAGRDAIVHQYWLALLGIARELKIPVIDYYSEILRRRPDDWNGSLEKFNKFKDYDVPTLISRDGVHPSNPSQYINDFSEEALNSSGYGLRNYMTLRKYYEVIAKLLKPQEPESQFDFQSYSGNGPVQLIPTFQNVPLNAGSILK